jgi:hypothetical protein
VRLIVALATCVLLVAVPAWAAARLGGDGPPRTVAPIDVRPGSGPAVTPPEGGFRAAASSRVHGARDCDDDGEVEFDDDDRCDADDRDDGREDDAPGADDRDDGREDDAPGADDRDDGREDDAAGADDDPPGADDDPPGADDDPPGADDDGPGADDDAGEE